MTDTQLAIGIILFVLIGLPLLFWGIDKHQQHQLRRCIERYELVGLDPKPCVKAGYL